MEIFMTKNRNKHEKNTLVDSNINKFKNLIGDHSFRVELNGISKRRNNRDMKYIYRDLASLEADQLLMVGLYVKAIKRASSTAK
jgi:hypothetical protein